MKAPFCNVHAPLEACMLKLRRTTFSRSPYAAAPKRVMLLVIGNFLLETSAGEILKS